MRFGSIRRMLRTGAPLISCFYAVLVLAACGQNADPTSGVDLENTPTVSSESELQSPGGADTPSSSSTTDGLEPASGVLPIDGPDSALDDASAMSEDEFLATYAGLEGVVVLDSGLMYRVVRAGTGVSPRVTDRVRVSYRGTLMNGVVFDETREGETTEFALSSVIRGWREAIPMMKAGGTWELVVPSMLAYGEAGTGDGVIGPSQPLVFEVTLHGVL